MNAEPGCTRKDLETAGVSAALFGIPLGSSGSLRVKATPGLLAQNYFFAFLDHYTWPAWPCSVCGRVWGNTAVCCRILDLCFLATPIIVKKLNNCANRLLKTNLKVIFRQEIFSVINSSRLQTTLDLVFLSYRIQVLALIWAVPPEGVLIRGGNDKVHGWGECLDFQGSLEWNTLSQTAGVPQPCWLLTHVIPARAGTIAFLI